MSDKKILYRRMTFSRVHLTDRGRKHLSFWSSDREYIEEEIASQLNGRHSDGENGIEAFDLASGDASDPKTYLETIKIKIGKGVVDATIVVAVIIGSDCIEIEGGARGKIKANSK